MRNIRGYWSDEFRNAEGEDLQTCLEKYGHGVEKDAQRNMKVFVIFLNEDKDFGKSWLIRVNHGDHFVPARLYSEDPACRIKVIELPRV